MTWEANFWQAKVDGWSTEFVSTPKSVDWNIGNCRLQQKSGIGGPGIYHGDRGTCGFWSLCTNTVMDAGRNR